MPSDLQPLSGYDAGSTAVKPSSGRTVRAKLGRFYFTRRTCPCAEKTGRSCRSQRSHYSVSSLLLYCELAIYRDTKCGLRYSSYIIQEICDSSRRRERDRERLVITFISLMNVPAIDRGGVGYGVNASTENGKLGMYKLAYEYSSTSAPGQT